MHVKLTWLQSLAVIKQECNWNSPVSKPIQNQTETLPFLTEKNNLMFLRKSSSGFNLVFETRLMTMSLLLPCAL